MTSTGQAVPTYDGVNKAGRGAKDRLDDSDHTASDPDINVQGNDQIDNIGAQEHIKGSTSSESNITSTK